MCGYGECEGWELGGRIQGGRSTAVQRDKKLWDCRVEREKKKKKQRRQMDIETSECVSI